MNQPFYSTQTYGDVSTYPEAAVYVLEHAWKSIGNDVSESLFTKDVMYVLGYGIKGEHLAARCTMSTIDFANAVLFLIDKHILRGAEPTSWDVLILDTGFICAQQEAHQKMLDEQDPKEVRLREILSRTSRQLFDRQINRDLFAHQLMRIDKIVTALNITFK